MSLPNVSDLPTPTLMRMARGTYAQAIRAELQSLGHNDLPRNSVVVLTAIGEFEGSRPDLPAALGVTKQAVSLVIDTLVTRGYLGRQADAHDRRRIDLRLTGRGQEVVEAAALAVEAVDNQLEERLSHEEIEAARAMLIALTEIKTNALEEGTGTRHTPVMLRTFSPIFPVHDVSESLRHYRSLGFDAFAYEDGDEYGFANRDGVSLHLSAANGHGDLAPSSAYLYVRDADALYEEWSNSSILGHTHPAEAMPWGLREGSHTDPDGNVIRFGSPIGK
jgi:DNA-binding MarR family transcriptional regulator